MNEKQHLDIEENRETVQHLLEAMLKILKSKGLRVTEPRRLILEAVAAQVGWHVHPKSVFAYVHEKDSSIGLATVYRTLKLLDDMDLLNKVYSMGARYHDEQAGSHYHLICLHCGSIHDINDGLRGEIGEQIKKDYDFTMTDINLSIYGLCSKCRKNGTKRKA